MMKYSLARFRDAGSLCAGLLIGLSMLVPVFAMAASGGSARPYWIFASPVLLALGLALQRVVTARRRPRGTFRPLAGLSGAAGLNHVR